MQAVSFNEINEIGWKFVQYLDFILPLSFPLLALTGVAYLN